MNDLVGSVVAGVLIVVALLYHPNVRGADIADPELRQLADFISASIRHPRLTRIPAIVREIDPAQFATCRCKPAALFTGEVIFVDPGIDLETVWGKSFLVHELTHAVQAQRGGVDIDCVEWSFREAEAIRVQNDWLQEQGVHRRAMASTSFGVCRRK